MKRRMLLISMTLATLLLLTCTSVQAQEGSGYSGSDICAQCHGAKYESYEHTWHAKILRPASEETVLGKFTTGLPFSRSDVAYVVGGQFSQRYLTEINGELYVLPAQWNVTTGEWVEYHPDDWQERPYTQYCAGCHTTGFDAASGEWVEPGVQCEACHGPGLNHVALAGNTDYIVNPALLEFEEQTAICGQCHLRGYDPDGQFAFPIDYWPDGPLGLDEAFIPVTDSDAFWPDGSSRQHHQEYLDWKLSGHAEGGVACAFCHVSHSQGETLHQTRFVGDHRCVICHEDKKDLAAHIPYHPAEEIICTDCHMPTLAQMDVAEYNFDIHSHTFWPPNPAMTVQFGGQEQMPNACNLCHDDQSAEWAAEIIGQDITAVSLASTATPMTPPTPVPTATPFLGVGALQEEQPAGRNLLSWAIGGLVLVIVTMSLILVVQKQESTERRAV